MSFPCKALGCLNYPISGIITCSALPKIDAMQQTLNPLERIVTLSRFNRWSCKRYHFCWIQSLPCHLCWLSQLGYKSSHELQEAGGFCVQSIGTHGRVVSQEAKQSDPRSGGKGCLIWKGFRLSTLCFLLPPMTGERQNNRKCIKKTDQTQNKADTDGITAASF